MLHQGESMSAEAFFSEVERQFGYLFDEHGFVVAQKEISDHFDVCEVMLQSKNWWIRIGRERGAVYVYVAPASTQATWFALGIVVTFLQKDGREARGIWWGPGLNWSLDYNIRLERSLQWYANALRPYPEQIAAIFRDEVIEQTLVDLQFWQEYRDQQAKDALARGEYPKLD